MAQSALTPDERPVMATPATVYYRRFDSDEQARGTLFLLGNNRIVFSTRRLMFLGYERHHEYELSQIMMVDPKIDGFETHVHFTETNDEPAEDIAYFYEMDGAYVDRWVAALSRKHEEPGVDVQNQAQPSKQIIIREIVKEKEIVKVRTCSHCGNDYNQTDNRCPHCGGR